MRKRGKFEFARSAEGVQTRVKPEPKSIWLLLFLWGSLTWLEVLLRVFTIPEGGWSGLVLAALFAIEPSILVYALCRSFWRWLNSAIAVVYLLALTIFFGAQLVYYEVFLDFFTCYSMANGAQVADMGSIIGPAILSRLWQILLMLLPLAVLVLGMIRGWFRMKPAKRGVLALLPLLALVVLQIWQLKAGFKWETLYIVAGVCCFVILAAALVLLRRETVDRVFGSWRMGVILCLVLIVAQFSSISILPAFGTEYGTAYDSYHVSKCEMKNAVPAMGMYTAFRVDVRQLLFGGGAADSVGSLVIPEATTQPTVTEPEDTTVPEPSQTEETVPPTTEAPEPEYNVLEIDWDTLIAGESNGVLKETHQYFASLTPSLKNEKTGMFEGCNLIMLTCEAFYYAAIDPELTPTLYKLQTEGFNFTNFYTSGWYASTTDGEYVALTGTIPVSGYWSLKATSDNYMPLVMGNQLKSLEYDCYAYHNHTYSYYRRDLSHPNLGYIYKGLGNGLDVRKTWPESDLEMMELTCDEYMGSEPFHVYYMTVSGHAGYSWSGNYMSWKNKDLVEDLPYSDTVKAYLATQIELDRALEYLLNKLEEYGIAENTVIVMTADHYPYGMVDGNDYSAINELVGHQVDTTFELYRNACIIYKKGMTPETIDAPCSSMDLLPTLSNLFGLEFDSRLYMGRDVFSDAEPLVFFNHRGWITDKAQYNASTGKVTSLTGEEISDEYVQRVKNEVNNKFIVSQRILEYDYWAVLFDPEE